MIKFFRKIRQKLLSENKLSKYLIYAAGEIVLVVIGILIALSINNWNEDRSKKEQLKYIYQTVLEDLNTDLNNLKVPIAFYQNLDTTITEILTTTYSTSFLDTINESNYKACIPCKSNINVFETFTSQNKGFELLKDFKNDGDLIGMEDKNLSQDIVQFYTDHIERLDMILGIIQSEALSNIKYYDQFPWYTEYILGKFNRDAAAFFLYDQTYRNKAANYLLLAVRNYLRDLVAYKKDLIELKNRIETSSIILDQWSFTLNPLVFSF